MKNIKYVILGILISFIIFFIIGILYSYINKNNKIHINRFENYNSIREKMLSDIDKIKNDNCRVSLKSMLDRIDSNNLDGDVSLKDYYESFYKDDLTIIDYYNYVVSSCNIEFSNDIYTTAMSSMVYPEYIKNRYNRSYEIYFKDYLFKDNILDEVGTYSTITSELKTLKMILEELS